MPSVFTHVFIHTNGPPPPEGALPLLTSILNCLLGGEAAVHLLHTATARHLATLAESPKVLMMPLLPLPSSYAAASVLQQSPPTHVSRAVAAAAAAKLLSCAGTGTETGTGGTPADVINRYVAESAAPRGCSFPKTATSAATCPTKLILVTYATG